MLNVLILGGYGFFGTRIARACAKEPNLRVFVAGRDQAKAAQAAEQLALPREQGVALDARSDDLAARLRELAIDIVVHTAGPFQGQAYTVARAALDARCHYIDLADGRSFVTGITALDSDARDRGLSIISGASSVPALSSAVVARYASEFERLHTVRIGIGSSARAPGLATVRGIFDYAGKPFRCFIGGAWIDAYGWLDMRRYAFPAPVGKRWMASCDVPDLDLLPERYPSVRTVTFHAGYGSGLGHLSVWVLAGLVRCGVLRSAAPLASPLHRLSRWFDVVLSRRGGMYVKLDGVGLHGRVKNLTWHLITERNHGPEVPCGAAIALVRKLGRGEHLPARAMPCVGLLTVEEYLEPLRTLAIREVLPV